MLAFLFPHGFFVIVCVSELCESKFIIPSRVDDELAVFEDDNPECVDSIELEFTIVEAGDEWMKYVIHLRYPLECEKWFVDETDLKGFDASMARAATAIAECPLLKPYRNCLSYMLGNLFMSSMKIKMWFEPAPRDQVEELRDEYVRTMRELPPF